MCLLPADVHHVCQRIILFFFMVLIKFYYNRVLAINRVIKLHSATIAWQMNFAFEMKLLVELGQKPELDNNQLSPGARQVLGKIEELDWAALSRLKLSAVQSHEIQRFLHDFLVYHLGKVPPARGAALAGIRSRLIIPDRLEEN